jgi:cyclopropane fatty-acyl-phospholipid synthase-like methyltransferase
MRVLDVGSGVGGLARYMAHTSNNALNGRTNSGAVLAVCALVSASVSF